MTRNETIKLLYPTAKQFPCDVTAREIVHSIGAEKYATATGTQSHNCGPSDVHDANGIKYILSDIYDIDGAKCRHVEQIFGDDFILKFGKKFGRGRTESRYSNDPAALAVATIPRQEIQFSDDESKLLYYVHAGFGYNWEADKERFMHTSKEGDCMDSCNRLYVRYEGWWHSDRLSHDSHSGEIPPFLAYIVKADRRGEPRTNEALQFHTAAVLSWFTQWLKANVLARLIPIPTIR